ncbi:hypothetical protein NPIL_129921 [Nephila pilipes]|uniref:MULE transposase domain-containing protein n=1 Tax=Nephila pilipes TaxID=299642 RepID=A0A8X6P8Z3_NEPPI|nr:hypothetical protein NPIL_129921 [Nephila pilipes]
MSDDTESFFIAWKTAFGVPEKRLLCTWHLDRSWRRNISRLIKKPEIQVEAYKIVRCLLIETEEEAFINEEEMVICEDRKFLEKATLVDNLKATATRKKTSKEEFQKQCMELTMKLTNKINKTPPEQYDNVLSLLQNTLDSPHFFPQANEEAVPKNLNKEPPNKKIKTQRYVLTKKKTTQKAWTTFR